MDFNSAKDLILVGFAGIAVTLLGWIASSISSLNVKIAVIIERTDNHEKRIERLENK